MAKRDDAATIARYTENLIARWHAADPAWLARGIVWYAEVHAEIAAPAAAARVPMETACGIAAALSIDNSWRENFKGLGEVLSAMKSGQPCPKSAHRYGMVRDKAQAMMDGMDPEWVLNNYGKGSDAYKARRFFRNLAGDLRPVAVDRHHFRMCGGTEDTATGVPSGRAYLNAELATINAADHFGIDPAAFQAALWTDKLRQAAY
jgi:hypothetical protein